MFNYICVNSLVNDDGMIGLLGWLESGNDVTKFGQGLKFETALWPLANEPY